MRLTWILSDIVPFLLGILLSAISISNVLACRVFSTGISFSQLFDNSFCIVSFSCEVCWWMTHYVSIIRLTVTARMHEYGALNTEICSSVFFYVSLNWFLIFFSCLCFVFFFQCTVVILKSLSSCRLLPIREVYEMGQRLWNQYQWLFAASKDLPMLLAIYGNHYMKQNLDSLIL